MNGIFNMNNRFWTFIQKMVDVVLLGLLALICCIPVITIVPSITALYYVVLKIVRDEEGRIFQNFFRSFRQNFKQGIGLSVIVLAALAFIAYDIRYYNQSTGTIAGILFFVFCALGILTLCMMLHMFPVLARFETGTKALLKSSFILVFRYLRKTLTMFAILAVYVILIIELPPLPIFLFGIWVYMNCCLEVTVLEELGENSSSKNNPAG